MNQLHPCSRHATLLALAALCTLALGCAMMRASAARNAFIKEQTEKHVYGRPLEQVWPEARVMLFEAGYQVKDTGEGATTLETEWKYESGSKYRYLVMGVRQGDKCQVRFTKAYESGGKHKSTGTSRDWSMEFKLIKKVDPDAAARIETEADARGTSAEAG